MNTNIVVPIFIEFRHRLINRKKMTFSYYPPIRQSFVKPYVLPPIDIYKINHIHPISEKMNINEIIE